MNKLISTLIFLSLNSVAFANSNLVGTWINNGQTLSVNVVDTEDGPFTAGELWTLMAGSSMDKSIKTAHMELQCSAVTPIQPSPINAPYGTCRISADKSGVRDNGSELDFAIWKDEAAQALKGFNTYPVNDVIRYDNDRFIFEANWQESAVAFRIKKSLIHD